MHDRVLQVVPALVRRAQLLARGDPRRVNRALAVGLAIINVADEFVSPVGERNRHNQPQDALGAMAKVEQLPRRSGDEGVGYDGLGIVLVDLRTTEAR